MPRVIWCLGMYASASTWLYNVVRQVHALHGVAVRPHFFSGAGDFSGFTRDGATDLVKSHEITDAATVLGLARRSEKIFVTMRDPRDAVCSLMLYHKHEFELACGLVEQAGNLCADFAKDRRTSYYDYGTGFFAGQNAVRDIAKHIGYELTDQQAATVAAALDRKSVETYIAKLPQMGGVLQDRISGDRLDPQTHWHTHHAGRSGEIGRWRHALTPAQAEHVQTRLAGCYDFRA
jgi:hypothetical protein